MTPTLSICITTRNRAALLVEMLDTLIPQLTPECQLVVVDGASTDDTPQRMQEMASRVPDFIFHRVDLSHGLDPDYDLAVRLATGRYAWLLSDDDWIYPGAIAAVLAHLASEPDLLLLNADVYGPDMKQQLSDGLVPPGKDHHIAPGDIEALALAAHHLLTFIGSVVIRRNVWTSKNLTSYYGTGFVHVGATLGSKLAKHAVIDSTPRVKIRYGNATWNHKAFKVWNHDWPTVIWGLDSLDEKIKALLIPRFPALRLMHLVSFKIKGCYRVAEYTQYVKPQMRSPFKRAAALLLACMPNKLFLRLMRIYFRLKGHHSPMFWFEINNNPYDPVKT